MTGDSIRRSIAFSAVGRYASFAISFVTSIILSRLLSPQDFGIFSIAMSFVLFADIFRDFGTGNYLIQTKQLTIQHLQSAFTILFGTSALCALVLILATPIIVSFYRDPQFWYLMPIFAFNMVLSPLSTPGTSLLQRKLAFDVLFGIALLGALVNFFVVVVLAYLGLGVMSLAWATLATSVARIAAVWFVQPCFGAFRITLRGWRDSFEFGVVSTATAILNVAYEYLPQLIIGRILDLTAVGLLGRATSLCQLPDRLVSSALGPVLLPALSRQTHAGIDLKESYLLALSHMSAFQWPILLCLALLAEPAVLILYGNQWIAVAPLVRIMALAALVMFAAFMTYPTLVAIGRVRDTLWMSLLSLPPSMLLIVMASAFGLEAIAATQFIIAPIHVFIATSFIKRRIGVSWTEIAMAVGRSVLVTLCSTAAPALAIVMQGGFSFSMSPSALALVLVGAAVGWLVGIVLSGHPLLEELRGAMKVVGRNLRQWAC
jgi:O-antigen/teichoic acid export membrane protein